MDTLILRCNRGRAHLFRLFNIPLAQVYTSYKEDVMRFLVVSIKIASKPRLFRVGISPNGDVESHRYTVLVSRRRIDFRPYFFVSSQ